MFGERKLKDEEGYVPDLILEVDKDKQDIVVKTIFRKA
jgi:hypothetical protein